MDISKSIIGWMIKHVITHCSISNIIRHTFLNFGKKMVTGGDFIFF